MTVEIVCVGTELLLGNVVNTNAAFLAEKCAELGITCYYQSVVGDNKARLTETFQTAYKRSDIVILSGGLGPTQDDLTKEAVAESLNKKLILDEHTKEAILEFFKVRNKEVSDNNWKQAMVPEKSIVLDNANGTAPGIIMEENGKIVIMLPGPPNELIPLFNEQVVPYLQQKTEKIIRSQTVKICGLGEGEVEQSILDLVENQSNPTIATYAKTGEVHIRVTASASTEKEANKLIKPVVKELKNRFSENIYTTMDDISLEQACVDLLVANGLKISTMESCTGGMIAARLINVPGVSDVFKAGYVTYSNKAKRKVLGVRHSTLKKYTAVSKEVAHEMALGVSLLTKADITLSVTGLAGPDGGTEETPVGTVFIGCSVKGNVNVQEYHFTGNRAKIRESATVAALTLLRKSVLEYFSQVTFGNEKGKKR